MSGHLSMGSILRNNRNLLRKKKPYLNSIKKNLKETNGNIKTKDISEEELLFLKTKFKREKKAEKIKFFYLTIVIIIPILMFTYYVYNSLIEYKNIELYNNHLKEQKSQQIIIENELKTKTEKYNYSIIEGDKWIENKNWNSAIFIYKNAVEIFPKKFVANYRLVLAYSYNCNFKNLDCEKGKELNNKLLKYFPNNSELQKLKIIFDK